MMIPNLPGNNPQAPGSPREAVPTSQRDEELPRVVPPTAPNPLANVPLPAPNKPVAARSTPTKPTPSWSTLGWITTLGAGLFGLLTLFGIALMLLQREPCTPKYRRPRRVETVVPR
jgi:hypothetical protein